MPIVGTVLFTLLVLAVPIGIALSAAAAAYIMVDPLLEPTVIFRAFFSFIGRYSLMAIPLFIFAGFLMESTGLVSQLFRFSDSLVGWMPGGFGVATVLACVLFGAISGSSVAMAAAMAVIAIPEMRKRTVIFRQFFSFIGRYSLMAIPLFIFAGFLMEKTGLVPDHPLFQQHTH